MVEDNVDQLIDNLTNYLYIDIRKSAAEKLGLRRDRRAIKPLINALHDDEDSVRESVIASLKKYRDSAVEPILDSLNREKSWRHKMAVAEVLGAIGDTRAIEPLINLLKSALRERVHLKEEANELIKSIKDSNLSLSTQMQFRSGSIRIIANESRELEIGIPKIYSILVSIGDSTVAPLLAELKNSDWCARMGAAFVLGIMKEPRAVQPLIDILEMDNEGTQDKENAAVALGAIGDRRAINTLITTLQNNKKDSVRSAAAMALDLRRCPSAVEPLINALNDQNQEVRNNAATALKNITAKSFIFGKTNPQKWQKWWNENKGSFLK